jgi:hypothetical protein
MPGSIKPEAFWYERRVGDRPQSVREGGRARRAPPRAAALDELAGGDCSRDHRETWETKSDDGWSGP